MTQPMAFVWRMVGFLVFVAVVTIAVFDQLQHAFAANPVLNSVILAVLLFGIGWNLRQVLVLRHEVAWIEGFRSVRGADAPVQPRLLAPMASMLSARRSERVSLSAIALRSVMDGILSRLDETRELSRYMVGLLIFLGLLGTFWGLLLTISSVADVIGSMSVGSGDLNALFNQLKTGLARPLEGMGTAFSTSMLGLAGALVLGFMDLTAGQAQNRFTNELEEWLAGLTRLSAGPSGQEGEGSIPAYVNALLEQTAENLDGLQAILARGEEGRAETSRALVTLTERLTVLTEQMRANNALMLRVADGQAGIAPALTRLAESHAIDDATRTHIRNLDLHLTRLADELAQGRTQTTAEIRNEIKILTRTIAAIAEEQPR
ncbi:flagellar motor protein MotA [Roseomonas rosulenta]|uniref:flagellar motor protein MotA n=1 Tax=Roseomonas rosulenta TaxID=2748667 RepID=UPI0018E053C6|nr:flagellar motor protein MotA [Roseomonas rosulenta]